MRLRAVVLWSALCLCALPALARAQAAPCVPQQTVHTTVHLVWTAAPAQPEGWTLQGYVLDGLRWPTVPPPDTPRPAPEMRSVSLPPDTLKHDLHGLTPGYYEFQVRAAAVYADGAQALSPYASCHTDKPPCLTIAGPPVPPEGLTATHRRPDTGAWAVALAWPHPEGDAVMIQRKRRTGAWQRLAVVTHGAYVDADVTPGTYRYRLCWGLPDARDCGPPVRVQVGDPGRRKR